LLAAGATLACVLPGPAQGKSINTFADYLSQGYQQMSGVAQRLPSPNRLPSYYANRSAVAMSDGELPPEMHDAHYWTPGRCAKRHLLAGRIESLQRGAARQHPLLAAIAQINFDCWVMPTPCPMSLQFFLSPHRLHLLLPTLSA
jgi:hypothetical protein